MEITNSKNKKSFVTKDNSIIKEILHPKDSSLKNMSLAEAIILPNKSTIEHFHEKSEEIYYILKSRGKIKITDEIEKVEKGDVVFIPPGKKHKIWNTGNVEFVLLCICSPCYENEDTNLK